jgi:hypothetical protein
MTHDKVDLDTFVGKYGATPRGIHTDPGTTFMFVVQGTKRMVVWPPSTFSPTDHRIVGFPMQREVYALQYEDAPPGIVLEGKVGDILYWPSTYWHLGVSSDVEEPVAALNVGVWLEGKSRPALSPLVQDILGQSYGSAGASPTYPLPPPNATSIEDTIPQAEAKLIQSLADALREGVLDEMLAEHWLNRVTAYGFKRVPPPLPLVRLESGQTIVSHPRRPIRSLRLGDELLISASGYSRRLPFSARLHRMVEVLAAGFTAQWETLADQVARRDGGDHVDHEQIKGLLEWLISVRAIVARPLEGEAASSTARHAIQP